MNKRNSLFSGFAFGTRCAPACDGSAFTSFQPAVSETEKTRMQLIIRSWQIPRRTGSTVLDLAREFNPVLRGWIAYYGAFYKQELRSVCKHINHKILIWGQHKYGRMRNSRKRASEWLSRVFARMPKLFVHWATFPADYA
jgi:RNA-directed DNA polymerase